MKRKTVLMLSMMMFFGLSPLCWAQDFGAAITYQGRLTDGGSPANDMYDFSFQLYDAATLGHPINLIPIEKEDVNVYQGYFTVTLDFGAAAFDGDARWLQIGVRPFKSTGAYTPLAPRHELTPAPHAIRAKVAESVVGGVGIGGSGKANYIPKFLNATTLGNSLLFDNAGNIGLGTAAPASEFHIYKNENGFVGLKITNPNTSSNSAEGIYFGDEDGDSAGIRLYDNLNATYPAQMAIFNNRTSGSIALKTGGVEQARLTNIGRFGLGTSTPATDLHVFAGSGGGAVPSSSYDPLAVENNDYTYLNLISPANKHVGIKFSDDVSGRGLLNYDHSTDTMKFQTAGFYRMALDADGYLGVGILNPSAPVHIYGGTGGGSAPNASSDLFALENDSTAYLNVITPSTSYGGILFSDGARGRGLINYYHADDAMKFQTASNYQMTIDAAGQVGIGTLSPANKLHVYTGAGGGQTPNPTYDPIAIESNEHAYLNIITPSDKFGGIFFSDDARNRGILSYNHATDSMKISTAGSTRFTVDSTGNVGIGDSTPDFKLDVAGNLNFDGNLYRNGVLVPITGSLWSASGSNIYLNTGNVGIGTSAPTERLHVGGNAIISNRAAIGTTIDNERGLNAYKYSMGSPAYAGYFSAVGYEDNGHSYGVYAAATSYGGGSAEGEHAHGVYAGAGSSYGNAYGISAHAGTADNEKAAYAGYFDADSTQGDAYGIFATAATTGVGKNTYAGYFQNGDVIVKNGSLGVGTDTPADRLHVYDNGSLYVKAESNTGVAYFEADAASNAGLRMSQDGSPKAYIYWYGAGGYLSFYESGATRMAVKGGNVGIGTTNPGTKLAVDGLTGTTSFNYVKVNTATGDFYYSTSSARYKEDIKPLQEDFSKILQARPKSFTDKTTQERNIGYIAEEFDELGLNHLVIYQDGKPNGLKYELVSLYLLEIVKQHEETNQKFQNQFDTLNKKLEALEAALVK